MKKKPLNKFWAKRFLMYSDDSTSEPVEKKSSSSDFSNSNEAALNKRTFELKTSAATATTTSWFNKQGKPQFFLSSLADEFVPFNNDVRMCSKRLFSKNEILTSLIMLITNCNFEMRTPERWKLKPDMSYYLMNALPSKKEISFRVRRRERWIKMWWAEREVKGKRVGTSEYDGKEIICVMITQELACAERYQILGIAIVTLLSLSNLPLKFRHSWYFRTFKACFRVRNINQTDKYEAIQKHLFTLYWPVK